MRYVHALPLELTLHLCFCSLWADPFGISFAEPHVDMQVCAGKTIAYFPRLLDLRQFT